LLAFGKLGLFVRDDRRRRLLGEARLREELARALEQVARFDEFLLESRAVLAHVVLGGKPDLDSADHGGVSRGQGPPFGERSARQSCSASVSLMNGIDGCASRRMRSSTYASVFAAASARFGSRRLSFASSM